MKLVPRYTRKKHTRNTDHRRHTKRNTKKTHHKKTHHNNETQKHTIELLKPDYFLRFKVIASELTTT